METKEKIADGLMSFFQGKSIYMFFCALALISLSFLVIMAARYSREARQPIDPKLGTGQSLWQAPQESEYWLADFTNLSSSNQFVAASFLLSGGCTVIAINYLPKVEGSG